MRCTTAVLQKLRTKPYVALAPVVYCVTVQNLRMANTIERRSDWGGRGGWVSEEEKYKNHKRPRICEDDPGLASVSVFMPQTQKSPFLQNTASEYSSPLICFYFCRTLPLEYKAGTIFWWHIYIYCISVNIWMCSLGQEISHKKYKFSFFTKSSLSSSFWPIILFTELYFLQAKIVKPRFFVRKAASADLYRRSCYWNNSSPMCPYH